MKKIISIVLALSLALSLVGCSASKPDTVVTTFCDAIKAYDFEKAYACMKESDGDLDEQTEKYDNTLLESSMKEWASEITYKLGEPEVDDENATILVSFTYVDATLIIASTVTEYLSQLVDSKYSDEDDAADVQEEDLFTSILREKIESEMTGTVTVDVTFNCVKVDGEWKIDSFSDEDGEKIKNILTNNIDDYFSEMDNTSNDDD